MGNSPNHQPHPLYGYGGSIHRHPTEEHLARAFLGGRGQNVRI